MTTTTDRTAPVRVRRGAPPTGAPAPSTAPGRQVSDYVGLIWQGRLIHYGPTEEAFASEDPFVRQFLAGDSAGPLGMD